MDVVAEQSAEFVGHLNLLRIGRGDREAVALELQRHHAVELGHRLADQADHVGRDLAVVERDEGRAPLLGESLAKLLVGVEAERHPDPPEEFAAASGLLLDHRFELLLVDEPEVDQDLSDALEGHEWVGGVGGRGLGSCAGFCTG